MTLLTFIYTEPDDPTGLRGIIEKASTTSVYIKWDQSPPTTCDGVTWYKLSYTMDKNFTINVTNITTNNTHYNLTELVEYTALYITLVAVNAVGKSAGHANTTITDQSNINLFKNFIIINMNMINSFNNSHVLQNIQCFNNIYIYYSCFDSSAYTYVHTYIRTSYVHVYCKGI